MQVVPEFTCVKVKHKSKIENYIGSIKEKQIQFYKKKSICGFRAKISRKVSITSLVTSHGLSCLTHCSVLFWKHMWNNVERLFLVRILFKKQKENTNIWIIMVIINIIIQQVCIILIIISILNNCCSFFY